MPSEWSCQIVAEMHHKSITGRKLAELTGYSEQYISQLLNDRKVVKKARAKIEDTLKKTTD